MTQARLLITACFPLVYVMTTPGYAQDAAAPAKVSAPVTESISVTDMNAAADSEAIGFSADRAEYDSENDIFTIEGRVRMDRNGNRLSADRVIWNRKTGIVKAEGNVAVVNPAGDTAYGDSVELTEALRDGMIDNLLVVLDDGGRLAAKKGSRTGDHFTLDYAAYTPCDVVNGKGCPKEPSWKITAVKVTYDALTKRVRYKGARMRLFGLPLIPLPGLTHTLGDKSASGILVPSIRYDRVNGFEVAVPYYLRLRPDRDLTVTPHFYTDSFPMLEAQFRAVTDLGAFQVSGYGTYGRRQPLGPLVPGTGEKGFRGYLDISGRVQFTPEWSLSGSARITSDRTFLRRYDISNDDRLRSTFNAERIDADSYFSFAGWATQTLRRNAVQGLQPVALPVMDYRRRFHESLLGGTVEAQLNTLALRRSAGQDTERAFAGFRWDLRKLTKLGQQVSFTGYTRGDVYHTGDVLSTITPSYRGVSGWSGRAIAAAAVDVSWPFAGPAFGGTQRLTPRIQLVGTAVQGNLRVPNEDSRSVDLEDSNLFALNRFPGYDRFEDGPRITYGLEWALDRPGLAISTVIGQSYRLDAKPSLFPDGTGLTDRTSDIVGRTNIRFKRLLSFTHRFRLDKDTLGLRRNEIDATVGTRSTYATVAYLRLDRNIGPQLEDLRDREEIRLGGRLQFKRFWSIFGSTTIDLTSNKEDPLTVSDGYEPVRHRLGIAYEDECLQFGLTWRRDYQDRGDARRGNRFLLRLAFKQLGR